MVNAKAHMNTHAGSRLRQATAPKGNTQIGSQPIQEERCTTSADSISLVSLGGNEVTLLRAYVLRRRWEVGRHSYEQNCEPVQCGKNARGLGVECIRRWRNSPMK